MTIKEIRQEKKDTLKRLNDEYKNELVRNLANLGMYDQIVRRKRDGKLGFIIIVNDLSGRNFPTLEFHPLKKDGTPSINQSGYISTFRDDFMNEVAEDYEPISEVDNETR